MRVIYDNTHNSDMYYAVKTHIADKFFYIEKEKKRYVYLDAREIDAFKEKNKEVEVFPLEPLIKEVEGKSLLAHELALKIVDKEIEVPTSFPLDMADFLRDNGIKVTPLTSFYPERNYKSEEEKEKIKENIQKTCLAFQKIEEILKESKIKGEEIIYKGKTLTSEFIKKEVKKLFLENDLYTPEGMIISSAKQASFPHHTGSGALKANSTIICDIFPRGENGYFADMTRTYVKGKPSKKAEEMYAAVLKAQEKAISMAAPGVSMKDIHDAVCDVFKSVNHIEGFLHGTGHGLGVDIHEDPYVNARSKGELKAGNVFTVEPGLYYPQYGGVRIEDVLYITEDGSENLTNYPKEMIIL